MDRKKLEQVLTIVGDMHDALAFRNIGDGRAKMRIAAGLVRELLAEAAEQPANPAQVTDAGDGFSQYRRKQIAELRPWVSGDDMSRVSVSAPDREAGSPKTGDMIARNPKNHDDQWLVAAAYFADNFEPLTAAIGAGSEEPVGEWTIDRSTDSPILTYEKCSVIQDEQAFYVLGLIRAATGAGGQAVADARYPSVFYSKDRTSRVLVAQYQGRDYITVGIHHDEVPHVWYEVELPPEEALQFALHILSKPHVSALSQPHPADERMPSTKSTARGARQLYEYWSKQAGQSDLAMRLKELADIEEMLDEGQGDDDGAQTMPDFKPGWSVLAKVESCLFLLEKRRDVIEAYGDDRLFRADVHMADGEIKMTAAEEVLAHLLINVIGVVDDQNYTPNEAREIIERRLSHSADERVVEALQEARERLQFGFASDRHLNAAVIAKIDAALAKEGRS